MRQYKLFACAIQVLLAVGPVFAGFERLPHPAAVMGRGFSGVALPDVHSLWLNPAVIAADSSSAILLFHVPSAFGLPQLTTSGAAGTIPMSDAAFAGGYSTIGFNLYREQTFTISAAMRVSPISFAGFSLSIDHVTIARYGSATVAEVDVGYLHGITENIFLGISLQNIGGATFGGGDEIPRTMIVGSSVVVAPGSILMFEMVKEVRTPTLVRTGVELSIVDAVTFRGGFTGDPVRLFGGLTVRTGSIHCDLAVATHAELGLTYSVGLTIRR